jgi:hypothetical protein
MDWDAVTHQDVLAAIRECEQMGEEAFLAEYGFRRAREYHLIHEGRAYSSKAILGVAYGHANGSAAGYEDFSGGKDGAAKVLRDLGFEVTGPER